MSAGRSKIPILDRKMKEDRDYWINRLSTELEPSSLRLDFERPALEGKEAEALELSLPDSVYRKLARISGNSPELFYAVLLASLKACLYKYTGSASIVVGAPSRRSDTGEGEPNVVALLDELKGGMTFRQLLLNVRETVLEAFARQSYPFSRLVNDLGMIEAKNRCPLFDVALVYEGLQISMPDVGNDITITFRQTEGGASGRIEYDGRLFRQESIEYFSRHFRNLLREALENVDTPIADLEMVCEDERRRLIVDWNDSTGEWPAERCIHQLFEERVSIAPGDIALVFEGEALTYMDLNVRANKVAHFLRRSGVGPESVVGLCMERSPDLVICVLAVLKAGGAYLPLDPSYPGDRLAFMIDDARPKVVLSQERSADALAGCNANVFCVDTIAQEIENESVDDPRSDVAAENLAYVIYTSGSTGKPKGVMIEHSSVCNLALSQISAFDISPRSRLLQFASSSFDASVSEIFTALLAGARLCLARREELLPGPPLSGLLDRQQISVVTLPPTALSAMGGQSLPHLKTLVVAGEACGPQVVRRWSEGRKFINAYGPTEATVCATMEEESRSAERGSIGRGMRNVKVYVLDERGRVAGVGVAGEIYIGGRGVGRGYIGREEVTAERYVPDPYGGEGGGRMYRTGDIGRYVEGGRIEYLGRVDEQVKVRGYRIELGEVEAALLSYAGVTEAVAMAREDEPGDKRLVAYFIGKDGAKIATEGLRNHLLTILPEYMVPGTFLQLESLPLSPAGKIDRRGLPAPGSARRLLDDSFVAPRTGSEELLANIWAQVLNVEKVGIDDNFFTLGGDSIRSVQVLSKAWDAGLAVSLQKLFELKTVRRIAEDIEATAPPAPVPVNSPPFEMIGETDRAKLAEGVEDAYPLSMLQAGMVYHSESRPDTAIYHSIASMHLSAALDAEALRKATGYLMKRHPALRTSFDMLSFTEPLQLVHREADIPLDVIDLRSLSQADQEIAVAEWLSRERRSHFDWTRPPLFRLTVHIRSENTFQFTFTAHHSILDGWSDGLALTELARNYVRLLGGEDLTDEPLGAVSFRDYIALEREALNDDRSRDFWTDEMRDATITKLPRYARHKAGGRGAQFGSFEVPIPTELSAGLQAIAQSSAVSLKSVLLAAHVRVMSLMSGQPDVITGLVANCRPEQPGADRLIGLFLNTIPLRARLEGGTWLDLARQMFESENRSLSHRRYPLAQIQRNAGAEALFETCFNYTHFHVFGEEPELDRFKVLETTTVAETNLTLLAQFSLDPFTAQLRLSLDYDPRELGQEQVRSLGDYYARSLEALATSPQGSYSDASLIPSEEAYRLRVDWNDTAIAYDGTDCIHRMIEAQVKRTPDLIALTFEGESITYGELNSRANRVAHYLRRLGVGREALVGLFAERSIEMIVGLIGILKAGAAYVPLSPAEPKQRLSLIIGDTGMGVLLTQEALLDSLPETGSRIVCLDADWEIIESESDSNPSNSAGDVTLDNLVYVIYTSGSTGRPKGAMNTHRSVSNRLLWMAHSYDISARDTILQKTPFSFDVSVWELFVPFMCGARLVMARPGGHQDASYLVDLIKREKITLMHFVPSMLEVFLSEPRLDEMGELDGIDSLRQVVCSGEALTRELVKKFHNQLGCELDNLYGPTECAVEVTARRCERGEEGAVPIGRPIANTRIYVLDKNKRMVPTGVSGELHIGGLPVGRGYLGGEDKTAESFIPDPFGEAGSRMYATGDEARYVEGGEIEYLGRLDHQVKIRGFRIELGEIVAALSRHPSIANSVVTLHGSRAADKRLVAYLVPVPEAKVTINELRDFLRESLPDYMVPASFVMLDALPLSPSGKVDRRALPEPGTSRPDLEEIYAPPTNPVEEILSAVWARVLDLDQVGIYDNFFALGGDSIRSVRALALARERGLDLSLQQLFQHQTIAELAREARLLDLPGGGAPVSEPFSLIRVEDRARLPRSIEDAYPLTMLQAGMLFHAELTPESPVYQNINSYHLRAPFDAGIFQEAVRRVVARHPILRTSFDMTSYSEPLQLVHETAALEVTVEDLRHLAPAEQEDSLRAFVESERSRRFDLSRPGLLRFFAHPRSEDTFQFTLVENHAVSDGWSLHATLNEIFNLYFALLGGGVIPEEPPLSASFRDFVMLERMALESEECREYWAQKLADYRPVNLPRGTSSLPVEGGSTVGRVDVPISEEVSLGLIRLARSAAVPIKSVLLAAHLKALSLLSGEREINTGLITHGRPEVADGDRVRGLFLNTLPFSLNLGRGAWKDVVKETFEAELEMLPHRRYPIAALQRQWGRQPLFETTFNFVHFHVVEGLLRSGSIEVLDATAMMEETNFLLGANFSMGFDPPRISLLLDYDSSQFTPEHMEEMAGYYMRVLSAMSADQAAQHWLDPLIPASEARRLLVELNHTRAPLPQDLCIHNLFESRAESAPSSLAAACDDRTLTYEDLNARANQLANYLRSAGVGCETIVAICLGRSLDMPVALLAVLKAGGAYLPLDPSQPAERLAFMLEDGAAMFVLTEHRLRALFETGSAAVICLDRERERIDLYPDTNPRSPVRPDNLAYVLYTSGSTGTPKGVLVSHRSLVNHSLAVANAYGLNPADRVLQFASIGFDVAAEEIFPSWSSGAAVVLRADGAADSPLDLLRYIGRHKLTVVNIPSSYWHELVAEMSRAGDRMPGSVRLMIVGSERVLPEKYNLWRSLTGDLIRLCNAYGPTETTVTATIHSAGETTFPPAASLPIGRPIANTRVYLLDAFMQPCPAGVPGELYVGGAGLARGYQGRPDLTASSFVPDAFGEEPGSRLYKTGDRARYLPGGELEFLGRTDQQVKVRGFRIEPGEVEAALSLH
ncbi:MAG TPA: amino acid adenylation domain-containing protein, partial [Blastocatellia bacterium]|nr:amino acid adenylation domain-containing protein [Blastocatellia bacterium]